MQGICGYEAGRNHGGQERGQIGRKIRRKAGRKSRGAAGASDQDCMHQAQEKQAGSHHCR